MIKVANVLRWNLTISWRQRRKERSLHIELIYIVYSLFWRNGEEEEEKETG